jgi:hypothetical protein
MQNDGYIRGMISCDSGPFQTTLIDDDGMKLSIDNTTIIKLYESLKHHWGERFEERVNQLMNRVIE